MKNKNTDMLHGSIVKSILYFFFPIMFGSVFQTLYNTVDAIIVGNFVGKEALGAVGGTTGTIIHLIVGFVVGLSGGATVVIAQYYGKKEEDGVRKGVNSGIFLAVFLGLIMAVFGFIFAPKMLNSMNVPPEVYTQALTYLRIYFIGLLPSLLYNNASAILRAAGDSKHPFYFLIVSSVMNIILDLVFVAVMKMGVAGAAFATVLSQITSCILVMRVLMTTDEMYAFHLKDFAIDFPVLSRILVIGFPVGLQACFYGFANLFIQVGVNSYGTDVMAAYTAFFRIDSLFWNASGALGQAILTFAGQNFGAGNVARVKKGIWTGIGIYVAGTACISFVCTFFAEPLFHLFTQDAGVIEMGIQLAWCMAPYWAAFCFTEIFSMGIRGCGDSVVPMIMTALGIGALRIGWILFYPSSTIFDTLLVYPVSWFSTSALFLAYYLQGGWLKRCLKQREKLMEAA